MLRRGQSVLSALASTLPLHDPHPSDDGSWSCNASACSCLAPQVPFVLGFFVLVQGLYVQGWVDKIAVGLGSAASGRSCGPAWGPGCWHDAHAGGGKKL